MTHLLAASCGLLFGLAVLVVFFLAIRARERADHDILHDDFLKHRDDWGAL